MPISGPQSSATTVRVSSETGSRSSNTEASVALSGFISGNWPIITLTAVAAARAAAALALRRRSKSKAQDNSAITDGAESSDSTEACCGPEHLLPDTAPGRTNQKGNP